MTPVSDHLTIQIQSVILVIEPEGTKEICVNLEKKDIRKAEVIHVIAARMRL